MQLRASSSTSSRRDVIPCMRESAYRLGWLARFGCVGEMCVSALFGRRVYDYRFVKTQATLLAIKSSSSCCQTIWLCTGSSSSIAFSTHSSAGATLSLLQYPFNVAFHYPIYGNWEDSTTTTTLSFSTSPPLREIPHALVLFPSAPSKRQLNYTIRNPVHDWQHNCRPAWNLPDWQDAAIHSSRNPTAITTKPQLLQCPAIKANAEWWIEIPTHSISCYITLCFSCYRYLCVCRVHYVKLRLDRQKMCLLHAAATLSFNTRLLGMYCYCFCYCWMAK